MNKFTFPLLIVITTICIYQFSKNKQNIKYINYMNEIIESKNLMINNLLKDDLYDINSCLLYTSTRSPGGHAKVSFTI